MEIAFVQTQNYNSYNFSIFTTAMELPQKHNDPFHEIIFEKFQFQALTHSFILGNSVVLPDSGNSRFFGIYPEMIELNVGSFTNPGSSLKFPEVLVQYKRASLIISCTCIYQGKKLCEHQTQVLYNIMERADLRIFFDADLRQEKIKAMAVNYGLQNEINTDEHFELKWLNRQVTISPRIKSLLSINESTLNLLASKLLPINILPPPSKLEATSLILVFSEHKYYKHLQIELYEAGTGTTGKIKNPITMVAPTEFIWKTNDAAEVKFYTGIAGFQQQHNKTVAPTDFKGLKAIVNNPMQLATFYHDPKKGETITALTLVPATLSHLNMELELLVHLKEPFYEISGQMLIGDKYYPLETLPVKYQYFILTGTNLQLMGSMNLIKVVEYFKKHNNMIVVHQSKFEEFRRTILARLEQYIKIKYAWLVVANNEQLEESGFNGEKQKIIYLSDAGLYVMISPVMRYGEIEVSILSKRQLYAWDQKGNPFIADRDEVAENEFTALLLKQYPEFEEQLYQEAFYLPKKDFLENGWFLEIFEQWGAAQIKILGFSEIKNNKFNANKATISIKVTSGLDWFNTDVAVRYGKQQVSLRQLQKTLKNGSRYVTLDDGTLGMLPAEWIKKMAAYFEAGEVKEETIRTAKINFQGLLMIYEKDMLSTEVQDQIKTYTNKLAGFKTIGKIEVPVTLNASLRNYQRDGLNWLNFLDDFGFGGCLADDMGLGKTIQVIAFILLLEKKHGRQTNLVVVPTSLIFNWQQEIEKFAPTLKVLTMQANSRFKNNKNFPDYDVVLISYGMLVSSIHLLKTYPFYYIFLDESQAIKNPDSQRYKTVRSLQSKNKIVMTGTPIENNTFDLYGQLSFACPGLLGNQQYFKDIYSQPIDKFGDTKRAVALQKKIDPFILRRTKKQVATELPEKTEMIIYCEMGSEQRKVYDAYEKEFRNYLLHKPEEDLPRESMHVLQGLTKLRQICNSPALLKDQPFYGDSSAKITVLIEQIESKSKQHKILVFSQFVSMLDLIRKELAAKYIAFEYLTGQTKNRAEVVENFQNNDDIRVFLISLKAGGIGLNLTEADYVYLVDPWWNPAVENQAIDRCYRIGQNKHVVAVRLICPDTIEEKIMKMQDSKKELVNDLIKTDQSVLKRLTKTDLLDLVSSQLTL